MIFLDRSRSSPDRYLAWKVRAFSVGAALGVLGMGFETWWLMGPAIAVLCAGVLLRFLPRRSDAIGNAGRER